MAWIFLRGWSNHDRDYRQVFCEHDSETPYFIIGLNYFQKRAQNHWYVNFSICFMENILFGQKKIKLLNKQNFVENETEIMQHVLKCSKFPCCSNV